MKKRSHNSEHSQSVRSLIEENRKLKKQLIAAHICDNNCLFSESGYSISQSFDTPPTKGKATKLKHKKSRIQLNPPSPESQSSTRRHKKPDQARVEMFDQLIAENGVLRDALNLEAIEYIAADGLSQSELDEHIENLVNDNDLMKMEVQKQEAARDKQKYDVHEMFIGLEGNQHGCKFWVPLSNEEKEIEEERESSQSPIPLKPTKPRKPCDRCEKEILMMSRIPPYPPKSKDITDDEKALISNYVYTGLNKEVVVTNVTRSLFYWRFIEMERTMPNIRLVVHQTEDVESILENGFDSAVIVAEHFKYINDDLKSNGSVKFLICAADIGVNTTNKCGHTALPSPDVVSKTSSEYDSLYFKFHGARALFMLNPERIVPLYVVSIESK